MRILVSATHRYPALTETGSGLQPKPYPSGSGQLIHDLIVKGLAELGHEVLYLLPKGTDKPLPDGVMLVYQPIPNVDILHTIAGLDDRLAASWRLIKMPWVTTCHVDPWAYGQKAPKPTHNWIFVSRTLARLCGSDRYVLNGIDPDEYIFSETKDDYFLFMSTMNWGAAKGFDLALELSTRLGFNLVVAGTGYDSQSVEKAAEMCAKVNATYVGDVRGNAKAELLAGAKALLFPTQINEAFGLGMAEALMSGTPVICSDKGACPEIISSDVGFVCRQETDYINAINNVSQISPEACRDKAMKEYHYLRMAADYAREYEKELSQNGP